MASFGECRNTYATFFWVRSTLLPQSHTCFSASRLVIPYVSWIFAESCSRLPDICWRSSELSLAQFSFAEAINCSHLLSTCSQFINVSLGLRQFIRWLSVHRHSILGTLPDRLDLTPILNVTGVGRYCHIRNAEKVFLEYV